MHRKISLILCGMLIVCEGSHADEETDVTGLVRDYVESIEMVKPPFVDILKLVPSHDIWGIRTADRVNLNIENAQLLMASLERLNQDLKDAADKIELYTASEDKFIKIAAEHIQDEYLQFLKSSEVSLSRLGAFMNNPEAERKEEELQSIEQEIKKSIVSFSSGLYHASEWVVEAIQAIYPDKISLGEYPSQERRDILKRLENIYEDEGGNGITQMEGVHFRNTVVPLYEILDSAESEK